MKYKFLVAAMLAAMPFMASSSTSVDGKAFTVNKAKVSTSGNLAGCPTLETPLKLTFTEDMKPIKGEFGITQGIGYYDGWLGIGTAINPWVDLLGNTRYTAKEHEIHIYVEFFNEPVNRFSDKGGIFAYADANGIMYSNGEYPWKQVPELGKNIYKAVITDWKKGETKSIYLPGRDFKKVEVFYFQDNVPYWDDRNNYQIIKQRLSQLPSQYSKSYINTQLPYQPESTTGEYAPKPGDTVRTAEALYLYQKLSRGSLNESTISFVQRRGQFNNIRDTFWTREIILFGGQGKETLRNTINLDKESYSMTDTGIFDNALKIESIDLKLLENKRGGGDVGSYIASYDRTDFSMTPENMRLCGLD
ncbi:TPA: pilus biosynthesis protein [Escherichia coli]|nr:pilus biosynthesis protein [Escherichia coli]HAN6091837.1 pilus biosynthesis protein [Escherichia coli]HAX4851441.1 pilus biosynthesis protein [Escherichia coli]HAX4906724.1 pilus biosynthesis protein [Escherichia coli]HDW3009616.1 pilus biosynthesis protein [Escherichia coli]